MPSPIPVPVRQAVFQRWQKGAAISNLAQEFQISERTLRHLLRRLERRGNSGLCPDYARCATKAAPVTSGVFQKAVRMREQHPSWGAGLIRILLQRELQGELQACPSERTLQRWFQRTAQTPAPPGRRPARTETRARRPHEVWQMDAADQMRLAGGLRASWLRLVDECSGAILRTTVFPPGVLESGSRRDRAGGAAPGFYAVGATHALAC